MGADLYLVSVMNEGYSTYRPAYRLAFQAFRLAQDNPAVRLHGLSGDLFDAVRGWFDESTTFDARLYDLVLQVRDLCQGETTVWLQELAAQLLREVRASHPDTAGGGPSLLALVQQISDLTHGRPEGAILALIEEIERQVPPLLPQARTPAPGVLAGDVTQPPRARPAPADREQGEQPLSQVVQKMRNVARGDALEALSDLTTFLVQREGQLQGRCRQLAAQLGNLVDRLPLAALAVPSEAASLPQVAVTLHHQLAGWRAFVEDRFGALRERLEEMQAVAVGAPEDGSTLSPADARTLTGRLDELAQGLLRELEAWHGLAIERSVAIARTLEEAGVRLPQSVPDLDGLLPTLDGRDGADGAMEAKTGAGGEATGPAGAHPEPALTLAELMDSCMRTYLQHFMLAAGSMAFFAKSAEKALDLARGQTEGLLQVMATAFVERVRPPDAADDEVLAAPEPVADGDVMDTFWYQFQRGVRAALAQVLRQEQEEEADPSEQAVFALALQLRDLVCGDAGRRFQALAARLAAAFGIPGVERAAEADPGVDDRPASQACSSAATSLAQQVCGLLQDDPRCHLRELTPLLLAALQQAGAQVPLAIARQMDDLLHGRMAQQEQQVLQELVDYLEGQASVTEESKAPVRVIAQEVHALLDGDPADQMWGILRGALLHIVTRLERLRGTTPAAHAPDLELAARLRVLLGGDRAVETDWAQVREVWPRLVAALSLHADEQVRATETHGVRRSYTSLLDQATACGLCLAPAAGGEREALYSAIIQGLLLRVLDDLEELERPVAGHFRDNYNETSALWTARWFWMTDVAPLVETDGLDALPEIHWWSHEQGVCGLLSIAAVRQLYMRVQETEPVFPTREKLERWRVRVDDEGEYSLAAWHARLRERREQLLAFLDEALRREEPILCSL